MATWSLSALHNYNIMHLYNYYTGSGGIPLENFEK